jgi:DNA mismatch repair protein MutL
VEVGPLAAALFEEHEASLAHLGLLAQSTEDHVMVTAVPEALRDVDADRLVRELAVALVEDPHADPLRHRIEQLCALLACHAALRSGDALDDEAMNGLLREMEESPDVTAVCNHGRPTTVSLGRDALESLFKRK